MRKEIRGALLFYGLLALCVGLCSCAAIQSGDARAEFGVQYVTFKFIADADAHEMDERRQRVAEIAGEAKSLFDKKALPIAEIERLVRERIDWSKLDNADTLLANQLINLVAAEIQHRLDNGLIKEDVYVTASMVLGWIEEAALSSG